MNAAEATVPAKAFFAAAKRSGKMRRAPSGAKGSIAKDTRILPSGHCVCVDTPLIATDIPATGRWTKIVALDTVRLIAACDQLALIVPAKDGSAVITIGAGDGQFWMKYNTTKLSIPAVYVLD